MELVEKMEERTSHVQSLMHRLLHRSPIYTIFMTDSSLVHVSPGRVILHLLLTPTHVNGRGGLHGAVSAAIIDFVTGLAIASWDLRDETGASVDMHISYLSSGARAGDTVEIEATADKVGGSMAFVTVSIAKVEEGGGRTVVTLGRHTKYIRARKE